MFCGVWHSQQGGAASGRKDPATHCKATFLEGRISSIKTFIPMLMCRFAIKVIGEKWGGGGSRIPSRLHTERLEVTGSAEECGEKPSSQSRETCDGNDGAIH